MIGIGGADEGWEIARQDLSACRVVFGVVLLVFVGLPGPQWILPAPRWMAEWFGAFLSLADVPFFGAGIPIGWLLASVTLAVALILGVAVTPVSFALAFLSLVSAAELASLGNGAGILLVVVALFVLGPSGWGAPPALLGMRADSGSGDAVSGSPNLARARALGIHLLATAIALFLLSGALPKVASGWLDPSRNAVRYHALARTLSLFESQGTASGRWALAHFPGWAWEALDWATIAIEGGAVLLLSRPARFRDLLAVALVFHAGIAIVFAIPYWPCPVAYLPVLLSGEAGRSESWVDRARSAPVALRVAVVAVALVILAAIPLLGEATGFDMVLRFWVCHLGGLLGIAWLGAAAVRLLRGDRLREDPSRAMRS